MENLSKTGLGIIGMIAFVVILGGQAFGLSIAEADATVFAQNIMGVVGFLMTIYGQYSRKDLIGGILRK